MTLIIWVPPWRRWRVRWHRVDGGALCHEGCQWGWGVGVLIPPCGQPATTPTAARHGFPLSVEGLAPRATQARVCALCRPWSPLPPCCPCPAAGTPDDRRAFGAQLKALKRRLHPASLSADLASLYGRYHEAAFAADKQAIGRDIVRLQRTLDDTEHASVFGAIDRAYAEVGGRRGRGGPVHSRLALSR
jgi:hypothetical protein